MNKKDYILGYMDKESKFIFSETQDPGYTKAKRRHKRHDVHVDGKNVGFAISRDTEDAKKIALTNLLISPEFRGKGLARKLIERITEQYPGKSIVLRANPHADKPKTKEELIKMYTHLGFKNTKDNEMVKNAAYLSGNAGGPKETRPEMSPEMELEDMAYGLDKGMELRPDGRRINALKIALQSRKDPILQDMLKVFTDGHGVLPRKDRVEALQKMDKEASPKWVKMWKTLSPAARKRLITYLPKNVTRQISKTPIGRGSEGAIFPSITGKVGDTVSKVHFNTPALWQPKVVTGGAEGYIGWPKDRFKPSADFKTKLEIFNKYPDLFPKTYGTTGRGYIMERLQDIPGEEVISKGKATSMFKKFLSLFRKHKTLSHKGKEYRMDDVKWKPFKRDNTLANIMKDKNGKWVISDPVFEEM